MRAFEFLTAFVAILIGLAITDLATSLHRLLRARARVKWDWAAPACAPLAAIQVLAQFWVFWFEHGKRVYTFASTTALALVLVLVFLLASAALPDEVPEQGLDLRTFYDSNRRYFWLLYALYDVTVTIQEGDVFWTASHRLQLAANAMGVVSMLVLAFVRWRWVQAIGILASLGFQIWRYFIWTTTSGF